MKPVSNVNCTIFYSKIFGGSPPKKHTKVLAKSFEKFSVILTDLSACKNQDPEKLERLAPTL